ncbi:putative monooxygenase [Pholiota conissans]|uniref:Monooxygenase n=1 Tax=Pholiota conissans TaxID=109636 RepID=A0A9P5YLR8_9AGAR|nr:putative monooxygenase [Pholiota conissans]
MDSTYATAFLAILVAGWFVYAKRAKKTSLPGPPHLPLIGSMHHMPTKSAWLVFSEWNKVYGGIFHLDVLGKPIVVINSVKIAKDLLDKRSSIYSDRPHAIMAGDLVGFSRTLAFLPYGDIWRKQRRLVAQDFTPSMMPRYFALQEREVAALVRNLLKAPDTVRDELQLRLGTIIIRATYGYHVESLDDSMLKSGLDGIKNFSRTTTPGRYLVDIIPALRYLPVWMPGAGFLKEAEEMRQQLTDAANKPYEWCKANLMTGKTLMPNLCGSIVQDAGDQLSNDLEETTIWSAVAVLGGGLDTNESAALSFIMAMILYPEVQKKAHAELDSVIGTERLPLISDRPNLPYIRSIMAETLRWAPPGPLGVPHAVTEDDVYDGQFIPQGTVLMANIWHMLHDPEVYPSPMEFIPERFNGDDTAMDNAKELVFGFGRRICPGIHFAEGTLFCIITTLLATCDILPQLDAQGREVLPEYAYTGGSIVVPEKFNFRLKARSAYMVTLVEEASLVPPE